ncbi:MAG: ABC transporter ATP-binding protein, partial [Gemmatimonadota bacterium]
MQVGAPAFELRDATVRYPGAPAPQLSAASFAVRAGECVAIVGPNGAGKTTALRALLGLAPLVSGHAEVMGKPSADWERDALAREVGVVSQREEPVFPITVIEAVEMGRYAHTGPWRALGPADRDAVARALGRADVTALADRWVETLSGGEWQRVRVARALAQGPRVLFLDEPTASLDLRHEMELFELVIDLVRHDGLAALFVSHHLNVAARFADRLVLVAGGRVVADAPPEQVLVAGRLSEVFGWPVTVQLLADGVPQLVPERQPLPRIERDLDP